MSGNHHHVTIMGVPFLNMSKKEFLTQELEPSLAEGARRFVVTANPEIVMRAKEDQDYRKVLQQADYIVADGIGIVKASEWMKEPLKERIAGFDLMMDLLKLAEENGYRCFFLGASEQANAKAVEEVKRRHPQLQIAGRHHGFFNEENEDERIADLIRKSNADLIFAALGMPRQEMWIGKQMHPFEKGIFMGVGGSFDVLAGEVKRAPDIWIRLNLEWAYRLAKQPFRWKRILKVFKFMFLVFLGKGKEKNR